MELEDMGGDNLEGLEEEDFGQEDYDSPDDDLGEQPEGTAPETGGEEEPATSPDEGPAEESFFDPTQVPEELLPAYKGMQRAFTQKMQEQAEIRDMAEAFQHLTADPNFQRYLAGMEGDEAGEADPYAGMDPEMAEYYRDIDQRVEERIGPIQQQLEQLQGVNQSLISDVIDRELGQLSEKYPDFDQYRVEVADAMDRYRGMGPEEAYLLVSRENALAIARQQAIDEAMKAKDTRRDASLARATTGGGATAPRKASSFAEAARMAMEQLQGGG